MTNLWCWLSSTNNSAAVQAIAGVGQALAAIITLGVMIWLGKKQNEIAKQQRDIAAYDKRHKLYIDLLQTIDEMRNLELDPSDKTNQKYGIFSQEFYALYYRSKNLSEEIPFLFDKQFCETISIYEILNKLEDAHKSQIENMGKIDRCLSNGQDVSTGEKVDFVSIEREKQKYAQEIMDLREILKKRFQEYLSNSKRYNIKKI